MPPGQYDVRVMQDAGAIRVGRNEEVKRSTKHHRAALKYI